MRGSLFGYEIDSEFELARLRPERGGRGLVRVERAREPLLERQGELRSWIELPGSQPSWTAVFASGGDLLVCCSVTGTYLVQPRQARVTVEPVVVDDRFEHRLVGAVLSFLLAHSGDLVLHSSAVVAGGQAILFCGPSGRGKSTLALKLAEIGYPILAEDTNVIEFGDDGCTVLPGPFGVRVARHSGDDPKEILLLSPDWHGANPTPVGAVVVLRERDSGGVRLARLEPAEAMPALVGHAVWTEPARLRSVFGLVAQLVRSAPVYEAWLPEDLAGAGEAAATLVERVLTWSRGDQGPPRPSARDTFATAAGRSSDHT